MAGQDRAETHDLIDWPALAAQLDRAGLFAVLRRAEAGTPHKPRIGQAKRPEQSIVDLAQEPAMGFAGRTLAGLEQRYGRPQLRGYWLGLTGPMGPLPTHLTEFAWYERRYAKSRPFGDWLDVMSGRMLQLFFRAWAQSQPTAHADRPGDDQFSQWLAALSGAMEGAGEESSFFERARVHYAALFAGSRSAVAIEDALSHLLGQQVTVLEFQPRWRDFEVEDRTQLGRAFGTLGGDAVLGAKIFSAADAFRVVVRAQSYQDYLSLMPGGARFAVAAEAIEAFKPTHLEWDLCVEIADAEAPPARLDGRTTLGWASWVKPAAARREEARRRRRPAPVEGPMRADAHLRKTSLTKASKKRRIQPR
jgi:type VI secretion system protein ImpH